MKKISMFYYQGEKNFGDAINPILVEKLFNISVKYAEPLEADLLGIGSITQTIFANKMNLFKLFSKKYLKYSVANIWGSGFNGTSSYFRETRPHYRDPETFLRRVKIHAVRGKLSKDRFETITHCKYPGLTLGDPGLLIPYLIEKPASKKYKLGIIPHLVDVEEPIFGEIKDKIPHSIIINVKDDPIKVTKEIAESEVIVSSALHGLIAADSFGIPNARISVSDRIIGKGYKFEDYYSVYDIEAPKPVDFTETGINEVMLYKIQNEYKIPADKVKEIQGNLIKCFPYKH